MVNAARTPRSAQRVTLDADTAIPTEIWTMNAPSSRALITELGAGGAFLTLTDYVPVGTQVELRFTLPAVDYELICVGVVRHLDHGRGIGVAFTDLSPQDQELVTSAVLRLLHCES